MANCFSVWPDMECHQDVYSVQFAHHKTTNLKIGRAIVLAGYSIKSTYLRRCFFWPCKAYLNLCVFCSYPLCSNRGNH